MFKTFTASGIHHIAIGPDHILFIVGLLLLGGTRPAAAADHLRVHARPQRHAVARGAGDRHAAGARHRAGHRAQHRLRGSRQPARRLERPRCPRLGRAVLRPVHGFGFASVLRETGLPPRALGLSLFSFNLGVEIGQAVIVLIVASLLGAIRARRPAAARAIVVAGSLVVIAARTYWFYRAGGMTYRPCLPLPAQSGKLVNCRVAGDVLPRELLEVRGVDQPTFFASSSAASIAIPSRITRRIAQNAPTRIAAVQWMNIGRFAGSSVNRRNSSTCASVGVA